jgi:glutamate racemase
VGVIATESTVFSDAYGLAIRRLESGVEVLSQACPLFVPLVEEGWGDDPVTEEIARRYLKPLLDAKIDTLVLGCTHYPRLARVLARLVGEGVTLVDSAESAVQQVVEGLETKVLLARDRVFLHHFCVTDCTDRFHRIAKDLLSAHQGDDPLSLELVEV